MEKQKLSKGEIAWLVLEVMKPGAEMERLSPPPGTQFTVKDVVVHMVVAAAMLKELSFSLTTIVHIARFFCDARLHQAAQGRR